MDPPLRQQLENLVSEARAHGQFVRWAAEARRLLKEHKLMTPMTVLSEFSWR
jgi:hypothetical protein